MVEPNPVRVVCDVNGYYAGVWTVTVTPKTVTFRLAEPPRAGGAGDVWPPDYNTLSCRLNNKCPHHMTAWGDGSYTVYPNRSGTPYYFKPVV
jgi:hypothetical protein